MQKDILAQLCAEMYAGGKQNNDRAFEQRDFEIMIDAGKGKACMYSYWQARKMEMSIQESGFLNSYLESVEVEINDDGIIKIPSKPVSLPHGWGVYSISALDDGCSVDFIRIDAGTAWKICASGSEETAFEVMASTIKVHNAPPCLKRVNLLYVPESSDEIPTDVVFDIINIIFNVMLKVKGFPIDPQHDNNPNVAFVNKKIAEAQPA